MSIYTPNKTSAALLVEFAEKKWGPSSKDVSNDDQSRFLLIYDLYIKARSYAIINKVTFWFSLLGGLLVLIWPALSTLDEHFDMDIAYLQTAVVQTTVTGIAALMFAIYSHYKARQMHFENLMRRITHEINFSDSFRDSVLEEIEKLDTGFKFGLASEKQGNGSNA